ncbi:MAG: ribonuclease H-like domain-containing protein [Clostridiales bacterium]|nr:ribonuclease H-like domain-containing protein [Clostridiales bacterium]
MPSLYDKLQSLQPARPARPAREGAPECLVVKTAYRHADIRESALGSQTLSLLSAGKMEGSFAPEDLLFLDTETTGLSHGAGTVAFLVGLGEVRDGQLHVTQMLMRDYAQETRMLKEIQGLLSRRRCLVTYNGASFDLPLLQGRMAMNRLREDFSGHAHVDLLHAARRVYKLRLGRCGLSRMEEALFGEPRAGDLPGSDIPKRYFDYLDTGDEGLLEDVLAHNRLDILSLARLFFRMAALHGEPLLATHPEDLLSLGIGYERQGRRERAEVCYRACTDKAVEGIARLRMAEMYRRSRRDREAAEAYESLRQGPAQSARVYIALAKLYEHRFRDPDRALEMARQGMLYCSERQGTGGQNEGEYRDLERRCLRLMRKVGNTRNEV